MPFEVPHQFWTQYNLTHLCPPSPHPTVTPMRTPPSRRVERAVYVLVNSLFCELDLWQGTPPLTQGHTHVSVA